MQKVSRFEATILIEALQETLKKQLGNYIHNLREIRTLLDAETKDYPSKLKGRIHKYYSMLDEIQTIILSLKEQSGHLMANFPSIEVWGLKGVEISLEDFESVLDGEGIDAESMKRGNTHFWDSDHLSIYSEGHPKNGKMGMVYLLGDDSVVKRFIKKLKQLGSMTDMERDVTLPSTI